MRVQILQAYDQLLDPSSTANQLWVQPYAAPDTAELHQFVLFFKPEVTLPGPGVFAGVLDLVMATLQDWDIDIGGVRLLRGDYLESYSILDQHYGVLNAISKQGIAAITPSAREKMELEFSDELQNGAKVLGGHQFLAEQPEFSALSLTTLSDNLGSSKLGGGTYAFPLKVRADKYILLNAFHAYQLEPFCQKNNVLVVMDCRSTRPWADLRSKLAGATDPHAAEPGSIRNQLLLHKDDLGLGDVSQGANGVHLSAGPLEGMVESRRFFSDHPSGTQIEWSEFAFASLLRKTGLSMQQIASLTENPTLRAPQGEESAFDMTEELDALPAAEALREALDRDSR